MRSLRLTAALALLALLSLPASALPAVGGGSAGAAIRIDRQVMAPTGWQGGELGGDLGPATATPGAALARLAGVLGVAEVEVAFDHVRRSPIGVHHRGQQVVDGLPVDGTWAAVQVLGGRVAAVQVRATRAAGGAVAAPVTAAAARLAALSVLGLAADEVLSADVERLLVPAGGQLVDTWRVGLVGVRATGAGAAGVVDVAAADGRVLAVADDRRFADATATLFDPNPIATSGHTDLAQDVDVAGADVDAATDPRVAAELRDRPIREFDPARAAAGNLLGPWVDVLAAGPVVPVGGRVDVTKTDPRFEGLMAYHHVDAIQRYFREVLGLTDVNAEPQTVVALPILGFDNSFYQPANDLIALGAGGVDDGEDAEVIIHELGHAIHDDQVPGWGADFEGGAMGEGFGDLLAAAYFARSEETVRSQDPCVMEWDATSYATGPQTCLRRTDTGKTYADLDGSVHSSGEIWSDYLWDVRERLGTTEVERSDTLLRLLLTAHFLVTPDATFADVVRAMITTATAEGFAPDAETGAAWAAVVRAEAVEAGIPIGG